MRFLACLVVNAVVPVGELCARLDEYARLGLDGVVWAPRGLPEEAYLSDAYLSALSRATLHARDLGLRVWVRDENGGPSGSCAGRVEAAVPDSRVRWLSLEGARETARGLRGGEVRAHEAAGRSSLSRACTDAFVRLTHERYLQGLAPEAFDHVEAFLSDEVRLANGPGSTPAGILPWPPEAETLLREQGFDVGAERLADLFRGDSEEARALRAAYWETMADCLVSGFYQPLRAWCETHGTRLAAHLKGEENPWFQIGYSGSALQVLSGVALPGIDALERCPHNHFYPHLAASAATQFGDGRSFCEAFGGAGNGATPEDLERYLEWIGSCGITDVVLCSDQLRLTAASARDWPASLPSHVTWREALPSLLDRVRRRRERVVAPDTVVLAPMRAIQRRFVPAELVGISTHDGAREPDTASARISDAVVSLMDDAASLGVSPHVTDERLLEHAGQVERGELRLGGASYQRVVAFSEAYESPETSRMLMALEAAGCEVVTPEGWLASLGKVTTSFAGMPETLEVGTCSVCAGGPVPVRVREAGTVPEQDAWRIAGPWWNLLGLGREGEVCLKEPLGEAGLAMLVSERAGCLTWDGVPLEAVPSAPAGRAAEVFGASAAAGWLEARVPEGLCGAGEHAVRVEGLREPCDSQGSCDLQGSQGSREVQAPREAQASRGEHVPREAQVPLAFLSGAFLVWGRLWPFDTRQVTSGGEFELYREGSLSELPADLLESGYAFSYLPVTLSKTVRVPRAGRWRVRLGDVHADMARMRVDDGRWQEVWGPDFETASIELAPGVHRLEVGLFNSTYNVLGPHHYYRGDAPFVTPAQFLGERNFADPDHAPRHTSVDSWHFVRWGLGAEVALVGE